MIAGERSINYQINPDVVLREEDADGALLFNPDTNDVKVLNNTGLYIWKCCQQKQNQEKIILSLKQEFEQVPKDQVEQEVGSFLQGLELAGFLVKSE